MNRPSGPAFEFGPFRLEVGEHRLLHDGRAVPLTPKIFALLQVLVEHAGHLVEKEQILKTVWPDSFVEEGALNRGVSVLRKALGETDECRYIETVPKRGYRFVGAVTVCLVELAAPTAETPAPARNQRGMGRRAIAFAAAVSAAAVVLYAVLTTNGRQPRSWSLVAPTHRQVTFTGIAGTPTLSPDGKRIAFVSAEPGEKRLMVQDVREGSPLTIFTALELGYPRWSPDGSRLVVWARGAGYNGIYVLPQLGGVARRVAGGEYVSCWSPDGSAIAVPHYLGGTIRLFDMNGQVQRTMSLKGDQWSIWDIDWSPTSGLIAFVSNDHESRYSISTIRADGSDQQHILTASTEITGIRWAPTGDALYFLQRANESSSLQKVALATDREPTVRSIIAGLESDRW
jgi:DNA-binding winged helix-turn-helix (wHTH) protein/dipeptidyl aminopeptidase/acylaminoacyl peptidase